MDYGAPDECVQLARTCMRANQVFWSVKGVACCVMMSKSAGGKWFVCGKAKNDLEDEEI